MSLSEGEYIDVVITHVLKCVIGFHSIRRIDAVDVLAIEAQEVIIIVDRHKQFTPRFIVRNV